MPDTVRCAEIAKTLNLTERRVQQLVKDGLPHKTRGQYDAMECARWYIRYLQAAIERRATKNEDDNSESSLNDEKKRLTRIQADIAQLEYQQKVGELIPAHLVDDKFVTFAGAVHDRFLALPSRFAQRMPSEMRDDVRTKLYDTVKDLLNGLSHNPTGTKHGSDSRTRTGSKRTARKISHARGTKTRRRS